MRKQFIIFQFQTLSSRRFQRGFDRVNLHRPTQEQVDALLFVRVGICVAIEPPRINRSGSDFGSGSAQKATGTTAASAAAAATQGLTLVQIFAQPEPFLALKPAKQPTTWYKKCSR